MTGKFPQTRRMSPRTLFAAADTGEPYAVWTGRIVIALAVLCAGLWLIGEGTYFVKSLTESHNIIVAAHNVKDLTTFLVQDVAASPDPTAHPYWYIHHPNLLAKLLSLLLSSVGLGLEGQVGVMLALNVAGLAVAAAALHRLSPAAAVGALLVTATSYGSFHFNAGDLCRGPLYLLLWPLLYGLIGNPALGERRMNTIVGAVCALAMLSDWGFALFAIGFAFCFATLGRGRPPWRWFILTVVLPAAIAFVIYELAVIGAVGWSFFWLDLKVTYLGRLGVGDYLDYGTQLAHFRDNNVVLWPPQGRGMDTWVQLVAVMAIAPLLNTGPAWMLLMPFAVWGVAASIARIGWTGGRWAMVAALAGLNAIGVLPLPVLSVLVVLAAIGLARVPTDTRARRLCGLVAAVVLGLLLPGVVFPAFTMSFMIAGGRPPLPLLEMSAGALAAELAASGLLARSLAALGRAPDLRRLLSVGSRAGWVVIGLFATTLIALARSPGVFVGIPKVLAVGLAVVMAGGLLVAVAELRTYSRGSSESAGAWWGASGHWRIAAFLAVATLVLGAHKSASPLVFERYSRGFAVLLLAAALSAVLAMLLALAPRLRLSLWLAAKQTAAWLTGGAWPGNRAPARAAAFAVAALLAASQVAWLALSVAARPPRPIPYANVLARPEFRGKSFLTTSHEAMAWYSTRGWAYMSAANPPPAGAFNPRFRHFADWRDEAKYNRPDFYLCDNTGFAYVRPGASWDRESVSSMPCQTCTCRDVAANLQARGNEIVVERDDFAIIRFRWAEPR